MLFLLKNIFLWIFIICFFILNFHVFFPWFFNSHQLHLFIILTLVFLGLFLYSQKQLPELKKDEKHKYHTFIFIGILLLWASNIFINLWKLPFHQDEQFHFSPAVSFNETWDFAKWDFLNNQIGEKKWTDRNRSLTVMSAWTQKLFWISEWSSRLPVALAGFLGLFLIYFVASQITQNKDIWLIAVYFYAISDPILYFSRFLRWYIFLALIGLLLFYVLYKFLSTESKKKKWIYLLYSLWLFILGVEFHATIILLFPIVVLLLFLFITEIYSIKKHIWIYSGFFLIFWILWLNILGIIHWFYMPYDIQSHISLNIDLAKAQTIYLDHITQSFHMWYALVFLLPMLFIFQSKKYRNFYFLLFWCVYIPLIFSIYFFNRYEDFRYILVIQPIFLIFVSSFIYMLWKTMSQNYIVLIGMILLFAPLQIPYVKEFLPITKTSLANWTSIEWSRLHFRVAQPENHKAFDYIFSNIDNFYMLRFQDGWINWEDNYYLAQYRRKYPNVQFSYFSNLDYYSKDFKETYNTQNTPWVDKISFGDLYESHETLVLLMSVKHLMNAELLNFIENNCRNIAPDIWIIQHAVIKADGENNYFPNVYICKKNTP